MSQKTSHRRAARKTRQQLLAEVVCRPHPTEDVATVLADLQVRQDKAAQR